MAKKGVKYYIPGAIALVFGIAAFCMMFLPAITFSAGNTSTDGWTGAQLAFGYKEDAPLIGEVTILNFNFFAFIAFLLPIIGGLIAVLFKNGLITKVVSVSCFAVGAVLMFSMVGISGAGRVVLEEGNIISSAINDFLNEFYQAIDSTKALGIGSIIGAVLSIIGGAVCLFKGSIANALGGH